MPLNQADLYTKEFFQALANTFPDAVIIADRNGNIIEADNSALKLFGFSDKKEILDKNICDFICEKSKSFFRANCQKILSADVYKTNYEMLKKDGSIFIGEISMSSVKNSIDVLIIIICDITQRLKTQKDLQQNKEKFEEQAKFLHELIEQNPLPIFIVDSKGISKHVNKAFLKLYNATEEQRKMVLNMNALTDPHNIKHGTVKYLKRALQGEIIKSPPVEFVSPVDPTKKTITKTTLFPIFDHQGKVSYVVAIHEDVTDLVLKTRKLEEKNKELKRLNDLMINRELKMTELKQKIKKIKQNK